MRRNRMSRKPWDSVADRSTAWLGPSLHVKGDLTGTEDLLIDGAIEGMLQLNEHKLTVGMAAKLKADINAREVVVYGCVQGNVYATGRIEIKKGGSVIGNRSEEHTSELQSRLHLVCRLLLEKKKTH